MPAMGRRQMLGLVGISAFIVLNACGEDGNTTTRSVATGKEQLAHRVLTEDDAGKVIETETYEYDIGLPDKKGVEINLTGENASTLRWRFAQKPDPFHLEWYAVDGESAFETDGLVGDPTRADKILEFRGTNLGRTTVVVELVEHDPAKRSGTPAKRLEFPFKVKITQPPRTAGPKPWWDIPL